MTAIYLTWLVWEGVNQSKGTIRKTCKYDIVIRFTKIRLKCSTCMKSFKCDLDLGHIGKTFDMTLLLINENICAKSF